METFPSLKKTQPTKNPPGSPKFNNKSNPDLYVYQSEILEERVEVVFWDDISEKEAKEEKKERGVSVHLTRKERGKFREWYFGTVKDVRYEKDDETRKVRSVHLISFDDGDEAWLDFALFYRMKAVKFLKGNKPGETGRDFDVDQDYLSDTELEHSKPDTKLDEFEEDRVRKGKRGSVSKRAANQRVTKTSPKKTE